MKVPSFIYCWNIVSEMIIKFRWIFLLLLLLIICAGAFCFFQAHPHNGVAEIGFTADRANFLRICFAYDDNFIKQEERTYYFSKGENFLKIPHIEHGEVKFIKIFPADNQIVNWTLTDFRYIDNNGKCMTLTRDIARDFWGEQMVENALKTFYSQDPRDSFVIPLEKLSVSKESMPQTLWYLNLLRALVVSFCTILLLLAVLYPAMQKIYPEIYKLAAKYQLLLLLTGGIVLSIVLLKYTVFTGWVTATILTLYILKTLAVKKSAEPVKVKSGFDWGMHYFRAFAIICVAGEHFLGRFRVDLVNSFTAFCTAYFLFISGYLAQYLFIKRPEPALTYYRKKAVNVVMPYLVFSIFILGAAYWWQRELMNFWIAFNPSLSHNYFKGVVKSILYDSGRTLTGYWYIPFVVTLFVVTPWLCRMKKDLFILVLFTFGFLLCIVPQRSGIDANGVAGENVSALLKIYYRYSWYVFPYILGMAFARYREILQTFFGKIFWACLILAVFIGGNNMQWWSLNPNMVPNVINLQKYCFIVCAIVSLELIKDVRIPLLDMFANYSFAIFFIHGFFMRDMISIGNMLQDQMLLSLNGCAFYGTILFLILVLFLSFMLKKLIGKYAKNIIGC